MPVELVMPQGQPRDAGSYGRGMAEEGGDSIARTKLWSRSSPKRPPRTSNPSWTACSKDPGPVGDVVPVNKPLAIIRLPQDTLEDLRSFDGPCPPLAPIEAMTTSSFPAASKADGTIKSSPWPGNWPPAEVLTSRRFPRQRPWRPDCRAGRVAFCEALAASHSGGQRAGLKDSRKNGPGR